MHGLLIIRFPLITAIIARFVLFFIIGTHILADIKGQMQGFYDYYTGFLEKAWKG